VIAIVKGGLGPVLHLLGGTGAGFADWARALPGQQARSLLTITELGCPFEPANGRALISIHFLQIPSFGSGFASCVQTTFQANSSII